MTGINIIRIGKNNNNKKKNNKQSNKKNLRQVLYFYEIMYYIIIKNTLKGGQNVAVYTYLSLIFFIAFLTHQH